MDKRTITVVGMGRLSTPVDLVEITLNLSETNMEYANATSKCEEKLSAVKNSLKHLNIDEKELKTTDYRVVSDYKSVHKENGYVNEFVGYKCTHSLKLELDFDNNLLSKVLASISDTISEPNLHINFTAKDTSSIKTAVLADACKTARENAMAICSATGTQLGDILSIKYSDIEPSIYSNSTFSFADVRACAETTGASINPEDIVSTDGVTITWEII